MVDCILIISYILVIKMSLYYELMLTEHQEKLVNKKYKQDLLIKEKEIKENQQKSGKLHKYTAKYYIQKEPEIVIFNTTTFLLINGQQVSECIFRLVNSESKVEETNYTIYRLDSDLTNDITYVLNNYTNSKQSKPEYKIVIKIKPMDPNGLYYCADGHPIEYKVINSGDDNRVVISRKLEIFDKYDLVCM
jgi:hypothetical protein